MIECVFRGAAQRLATRGLAIRPACRPIEGRKRICGLNGRIQRAAARFLNAGAACWTAADAFYFGW